MSTGKKVLLIILVILIIIQFIRPEKNLSSGESQGDIFTHYAAGDSAKQLVRTICYNCHSNNTVYPWYSSVQPFAWWLDHHIKEGKAELNFSEFTSLNAKDADHKMEEVAEEVREKAMPLKSYALAHPEARLSDAQRELIINWAEGVRKQIAAK